MYLFPVKILYKDANYYPFSTHYLVPVVIGSAASKLFTFELQGVNKLNGLDLREKEEIKVLVKNIYTEDIEIEEIRAVTSNEINVSMEEGFSKKLKPNESFEIPVKVTKLTALLGSTYVVSIMVSGVSGEKHFSEETRFFVKVVESKFNLSSVYYGGFILLGL
jgi:hypothetical protein